MLIFVIRSSAYSIFESYSISDDENNIKLEEISLRTTSRSSVRFRIDYI